MDTSDVTLSKLNGIYNVLLVTDRLEYLRVFERVTVAVYML